MITVMMPTFNRPQFIRRAVDAVLGQSFKDVQLIVKDGGQSIRKLLPRDPRLLYVNAPDTGIADAMNQALGYARGTILHWANDDDVMAEGALEFVHAWMGDAVWMYGKMTVVTVEGNTLYQAGGSGWGKPHNWQSTAWENGIPQPTVYWKRWAGETIGTFDAEIGVCCDADYWVRLAKRWQPKVTDRVLGYYTEHANSYSVRNNIGIQLSKYAVREKHLRG